MVRRSQRHSWWLAVTAVALAPLLPGCSLIVGKAASTGIGSVRDVEVNPDQVSLSIGQQQQFTARATKVIGNSGSADPDWELVGEVGFLSASGLFIATNPGQGTIRATVKTAGGLGNVVGKATVYIPPPPDGTPTVSQVTVDPPTSGPGSTITFTATVVSPNGPTVIGRVLAVEPATGFSTTLLDDGVHNGDLVAGDGVFTGKLVIPASVTKNQLRFGVHAEDYNAPPASSPWVWVTVPLSGPGIS